jgi:hypothetical protein
MRWAASQNNGFAIPQGYFLQRSDPTYPSFGTLWPPERYLAKVLSDAAAKGIVPTLTDADKATATDDIRYWNAAVIVLADYQTNRGDIEAVLVQILGPSQRFGDAVIWDTRNLLNSGAAHARTG